MATKKRNANHLMTWEYLTEEVTLRAFLKTQFLEEDKLKVTEPVMNQTAQNLKHEVMSQSTELDRFEIYFIGDSDIERWPKDLLPSVVSPSDSKNKIRTETTANSEAYHIHARGGATMREVARMAHQVLERASTNGFHRSRQDQHNAQGLRIVVGCAGENDSGQGILVDDTLAAFQDFLRGVFGLRQGHENGVNEVSIDNTTSRKTLLLFFGPKLEPWMAGDTAANKQYAKLSRGLQRACNKFNREILLRGNGSVSNATHHLSSNGADVEGVPPNPESNDNSKTPFVYFVDCLTMFCLPSTIDVPGAVMGCKAIADLTCFDNDYLHLNEKGYTIWKDIATPLIEHAVRHGSWPV